jgi:hypothetical protein
MDDLFEKFGFTVEKIKKLRTIINNN